jgi:ADP-ribose pyrophosphatase YjhB (NUDIX family)
MAETKHPQHPQPVAGVLVEKAGKFLLVSSGKKWAHPVTAIEFGEEPLDAVNRLLADYGLKAAVAKLIGVHNIIRQDIDRYEWEFAKEHLVALEYLCKAKSMATEKDHLAAHAKWVSAAEAAKMPLQHYTEELLLLYKPKSKRMIKPWQQRIKKR